VVLGITSITYTVFDNKFKSIGQFKINKKESVRIISNINDQRIDKLAYKSKEKINSFWAVIKFSLLLFVSIGGFFISGIILLVNHKKK
jgi:hypothetical protein